MSNLIILSGELNENINDLILELSNLIKTQKFKVVNYLELDPTKLNNRKAQFYKDFIVFGNEDIQLNNFGRITSNLGSLRLNNTNMTIRQNLNVSDTIFIDYIGNTSDTEFGVFVNGGLISNNTKLQSITLHNDVTLGGTLKVAGLLTNYGNTFVANSLIVNGNIDVGSNVKNIIFGNIAIFGNNKINYPISGNINGNLLNVNRLYSNNISGNLLDNTNIIIASNLYSNLINVLDTFRIEELESSKINIGSGNISSINVVSNIYSSDFVKTNNLQATDLIIDGNISALNIINPSNKYIANIINTNSSTFTDLVTSNLTANNIFVSGYISVVSLTVSNIDIEKLNIGNLISNKTLIINGLNISENCIITGNNIYNNVDGVTIGENIITINSLNKLADTGISFSYSDKYIGYIYKYFGTEQIEGNSFVFAKINSANVDNNDPIINIDSLLPIYTKQIEGNIHNGLYIANKGNLILYSSNIFINDYLVNYNNLIGNNIYANNISIDNNFSANNIYGNVYNIKLIDGQDILISNLDQTNSNILISNIIVSEQANISNLNVTQINYNNNTNGNIIANIINSSNTSISGNINSKNIVVNGNVSANSIFIENVSVYSNNTIEFINNNKTLTSDINIFVTPEITCNIDAPSYKIISNTYFYQNNLKYLKYDNQFNGNIFINLPRGKINLNKEDDNRKLYFNNEQWVDLDNKSFYADRQYAILQGNTTDNYGQGMACKLNSNGKYLFIGGPNYASGNIWLFERNVTVNNVPNMGWSEITRLFTQFNSNHPINSNIYSLGESIDCSSDGSIMIASAKTSEINGTLNIGAVCIFENNNGIWNSNIIYNTSSYYFGNSIAISNNGSKILVGRTYDDSNTGTVFLYNKPINGWINGPHTYSNLIGSNITTNSLFGAKVKFGGENIICVGGREKVWLFRYDGLNWNEFQVLTNTSTKAGYGQYGMEFSDNTDILCIAAPLNNKGIIFIYKYFGKEYKLIQNIDFTIDMFSSYDPAYQGFSLALSGDARTLYIGSPYSVSGIGTINFTNRGIYVYRRFNNKWIQIKEMNYSNDPTYYYHIGYSMSTTTDGSILSVGGPSTFDFFGTPYIGIGSVGVFY